MVFHRYVVRLRRRWGKSGHEVCVHSSISKTYAGVVVFQRSILNLQEGGDGVSLPWVYVQSSTGETYLQCSGFPQIYAQLEEGVGSVYLWYMCIPAICETLFVLVVFQKCMLS